ncbi:MAG: hypothetical protein EP343_08400 [Deltaproteobacteria bacterium]|nr:MAG: hypothetical protein EP343_08400 [Deltaproteobacteria bacterium]
MHRVIVIALLLGFVCSLWACDLEIVRVAQEKANEERSLEPPSTEELSQDTANSPDEASTQDEAGASEEPVVEPEPAGIRQLHQPCNPLVLSPLNQQCKPGLRCIRINALDAFCLQDCSLDSNACQGNSDGRTVCRQIAWTQRKPFQPVKVCIQEVEANKACDLKKSTLCQRAGTLRHFVCKEGQCLEGNLVTEAGKPCGVALPNPVECDITQGLVCSSHNNLCNKGYPALEGDICGVDDLLCEPGFQCMNLTVGPNICVKQCNLNLPAEKACPFRQNFRCIPNNDGRGVCLQLNCSVPSECLYQNVPHQCYTINLQGTPTKACLPAESGSQTLGKSCNATGSRGCKYPFVCVESGSGSGYSACVPPCQYTSQCKEYDPRMVCNSQAKVCMWQCKDKSDCPRVMDCAPVGVCGSKNP